MREMVAEEIQQPPDTAICMRCKTKIYIPSWEDPEYYTSHTDGYCHECLTDWNFIMSKRYETENAIGKLWNARAVDQDTTYEELFNAVLVNLVLDKLCS